MKQQQEWIFTFVRLKKKKKCFFLMIKMVNKLKMEKIIANFIFFFFSVSPFFYNKTNCFSKKLINVESSLR